MSTKFFRLGAWLALAVALAAIAALWHWRSGASGSAEAYRTAKVDRGDIRVSVSATGSLNALSTVDVGTQVSGLIESVTVDYNDKVKKGQVIARIDRSTVQARVSQVAAALASAQASGAQARAGLKQAEADYARKRDLVERQLVARSDFDLATAALGQARAQVDVANANIRQQQAVLDSARVDLGHTDILSPVDGVILARSVEPGQTVAASFQTPVLFQIAEDLRQMQIVLAVDEADIGQVKPGQKTGFTVDAFPDRRFEGEVQQVRLAASNTANVITYPVVVSVNNADLSLLPGMTVNAEIEVSRRDSVLRIPNAALRYKLADASLAAAAPTPRAGGGLVEELPGIAVGLKLDANQQAAFDSDLTAMRERFAARAAAAQTGNAGGNSLFGRGPGGPTSGGNSNANDGAARQRMLERFGQQFAAFRQSLRPEQLAQWDGAITALVSSRRAPIYKLVDGKPQAVTVRIGASDGSFTEVSGDLRDGDAVIVGNGRAAQ